MEYLCQETKSKGTLFWEAVLNIDLIQMGVGGNDSWSDVAAPLEKYQVKPGDYTYRFYLCPVKMKEDQVTKDWQKLKF